MVKSCSGGTHFPVVIRIGLTVAGDFGRGAHFVGERGVGFAPVFDFQPFAAVDFRVSLVGVKRPHIAFGDEVKNPENTLTLGKINVGPKFIHISGASASHGCALFIESIIKNAGYRVGRINTAYKFDIMKTVYIDRQIPVIDDYNKAVAAIRQIVNKKSGEIYKREEIV